MAPQARETCGLHEALADSAIPGNESMWKTSTDLSLPPSGCECTGKFPALRPPRFSTRLPEDVLRKNQGKFKLQGPPR